jgi:hypothetical protein
MNSLAPRGNGGIGRHAGLRSLCLRTCGFKSRFPHKVPPTKLQPLSLRTASWGQMLHIWRRPGRSMVARTGSIGHAQHPPEPPCGASSGGNARSVKASASTTPKRMRRSHDTSKRPATNGLQREPRDQMLGAARISRATGSPLASVEVCLNAHPGERAGQEQREPPRLIDAATDLGPSAARS